MFKAQAPKGSGWQAIPGGKRGGYRKRVPGGWTYWYRSAKHATEHAEHHTAAAEQSEAAAASFEAKAADGPPGLVAVRTRVAGARRKRAEIHREAAAGAEGWRAANPKTKDGAWRPVQAEQAHAGQHTLGADEGIIWATTADLTEPLIEVGGKVTVTDSAEFPETTVTVRGVDGRKHTLSVKLKPTGLSHGWPGSLASKPVPVWDVRNDRLSDTEFKLEPVAIEVGVPSITAPLAVIQEQIRSTLAHELTHALDVIASKRSSAYGDYGADYFNDPAEVKAWNHMVFRELNTPAVAAWVTELQATWALHPEEVDELKEWVSSEGRSTLGIRAGAKSIDGATVVDVLDQYSPTWRKMNNQLDPKARRRFLKMAAGVLTGHIDGTSVPMEKAVPQPVLVLTLQKSPGAGWSRIPNSKKGGYRKKTAKGWDYWYPEGGSQGAAPAAAAPEAHPPLPYSLDGDDYAPGGTTTLAAVQAMLSDGTALRDQLTTEWLKDNWRTLSEVKSSADLYAAFDAYDDEVDAKVQAADTASKAASAKALVDAVAKTAAARAAGDPGPVSTPAEGKAWAATGAFPEPVYHATFAGSAIMDTGLKARADVGGRSLGGGPDNAVSTTPGLDGARKIAAVFSMLAAAEADPDAVKAWLDEHWTPLIPDTGYEFAHNEIAAADKKADGMLGVIARINKVSYVAGRTNPAVLVPSILGRPKPGDLKDIGVITAYGHVDAVRDDKGRVSRGPGAGSPAANPNENVLRPSKRGGAVARTNLARGSEHLAQAHIAVDTENAAEQGEIRFAPEDLTTVGFEAAPDWRSLLKPMAKSQPPGAGWSRIPNSKKGGYRKKTAKGWDYYYPEAQGQPKAAPAPAVPPPPAAPLRGDDRGPLTLYQGNDASSMHTSPTGGSEHGIYLTPRRTYAQQYGANLHRTWVKLANPKVVENKGEISPSDITAADVAKLQAEGYDGIIVKTPGAPDHKASEIVVFDAKSLIPYGDLNAFSDAKNARADYDYEHGIQKSMGGYLTTYQGIPLRIENPRGSVRTGVSPRGQRWTVRMLCHYGEIPGTIGADNEPLDVYVGPDSQAEVAYVIHQRNVDGTRTYDESKIMLGFATQAEAVSAWAAHFASVPLARPGVSTLPISVLRDRLGCTAAPADLSSGVGPTKAPHVAHIAQAEPSDAQGHVLAHPYAVRAIDAAVAVATQVGASAPGADVLRAAAARGAARALTGTPDADALRAAALKSALAATL